jgi:uncharacterized protein (TIGR02246 family)
MSRRAAVVMTALALGIILLIWMQRRSPETPLPELPPPPDREELHQVTDELLDRSADAWNAGDLDGFMRWYAPGPDATYIGRTGLIRGREAIRERYAPLFGPGAERDSLRFEGLEARPLGPDLGLATARYVLYQDDSTTAIGAFTLVLRRIDDGWRIIHDHSSELSP